MLGAYFTQNTIQGDRKKFLSKRLSIGLIIASGFVLALIFGFRGLETGADTERYYRLLDNIRIGLVQPKIYDDGAFTFLVKLLTLCKLTNVQIIVFFAFLYVFLIALFAIRSEYDILLVWLLFVVSFVFIDLGMNLVKAGIATAIALNGFQIRRRFRRNVVFVLASAFHISALLYILVDLLADRVKASQAYLGFFCATILLYFGMFKQFIPIIGDNIVQGDSSILRYALAENFNYRTGFRLDFIIFSFLPVVYIFLFKKAVVNQRLLVVYLLLNIVFISLMDFPFSNRIGYFAWIMHAILLFQGRFTRGLLLIFPVLYILVSWIIYVQYLW